MRLLTALLLVLGLYWATSMPTQAETPPNTFNNEVAIEDIENAVEVKSMGDVVIFVRPDALSGRQYTQYSDVYRIAGCNDNEAPCYFRKSLIITPSQGSQARTTTTVTCGVQVTNSIGSNAGRLQQNVNISFDQTYPVTANWANSAGSYAVSPYIMDEFNGPNVSPGLGQPTNNLYSTVEANFHLPGFYGIRASSLLSMTAQGGFRCS